MPERDPESIGSPLIVEARKRFAEAAEAGSETRKSILQAKQFRAGNQWDEQVKIQRMGAAAIQGQAAQPPRPCLTIDRISQPVRNVSNSVKQANFAITVHPNGHGADDETAKIFKGLLRKAQNDARAESPFEWAADGAAEGGIGWFRLRSRFCHDQIEGLDPAAIFDQELAFERIQNNLSVYCDPAARLPTRRDARYMFVTENLRRGEFRRKYPDAKLTALDEFRATGDTKEWVTEADIRVAEYWRVEFDKRRVALVDGELVEGDAIPKDADPKLIRTVFVPSVKWSKITATEELESGDWPGLRIPLFPILGEELNVDGTPIVRGVIQPAIDAQRMVNYMYSGAIEAIALAPKAPLIIAEGQVEGYEALWQNANRFNYSYLPYKPQSLMGATVPPPTRSPADPNIAPMVEMLVRSEDAIKATTGIYDPSLGNTNPKEKSGRAILALQKQTDLGQSNYLWNVSNALLDAGQEFVYVAPKIYDRPERIIQILGIDDEPEQVMLGAPFVKGQDGIPQKVPVSPEQAKQQKGLAEFYDLSQGQYGVTVDIGKSSATAREEGVAVLGEMLSANPQLLQIFGDIFFRDMDTPGAQEISERMKKMLAPQLQSDGQEPSAQQLQQQIQQAGQLIEVLSKELEAKTKIVEEETVQAQRDLELAKINNASKEKIAELQAQAKLIEADAKLDAQAGLIILNAKVADLQAQLGARLQTDQQQRDQQHAREMAEADRAHDAGMLGASQEHEATLAQMPPPVDPNASVQPGA